MTQAAALSDAHQTSLERLFEAEQIEHGTIVTVSPASVDQVQALVRWAAAAGAGLTLRSAPAAEHKPCVRLRLGRLQSVRFFEPRDLTLGVDAGLALAVLGERVEREGEFLPADVADPEAVPVGEWLAKHLSGPLRHGFGTVRDFVIGIEFVSAEGALVHGGGRVVKNVAGYDLMKLLIGSWGTLGIITGANFKLFPRPLCLQTTVIAELDSTSAEALRTRLLHAPLRPLAVELVSEAPKPAAGAAPAARGSDGFAVYVRYGGPEAVRQRYSRELAQLAEGLGRVAHPMEDDPPLWAAINRFVSAPNLAKAEFSLLRVAAPPAAAVSVVERLRDALATAHSVRFQGRLALGAFLLRTEPAVTASELQRCRELAHPVGGYIEILSGSIIGWPERTGASGNDAQLMRELKQQFDPGGIFEPGIRLA